ncbi:Hypothetical predicted protein [Podarcis lilfordi]|uniref:Secreted protein n=1 Tax=Podarcis lilfordi TaxID=74358 RepID=A0AA35PUV5_9SAUR|nr:Hypothetical predicted protein [Podarcis lilfordi]
MLIILARCSFLPVCVRLLLLEYSPRGDLFWEAMATQRHPTGVVGQAACTGKLEKAGCQVLRWACCQLSFLGFWHPFCVLSAARFLILDQDMQLCTFRQRHVRSRLLSLLLLSGSCFKNVISHPCIRDKTHTHTRAYCNQT